MIPFRFPPAGAALRVKPFSAAMPWLQSYYRPYQPFFYGSGTQALASVIEVMKRLQPERANVLLSGYTCPAVVSAIRFAGCRPCFVDIDPAVPRISLQELQRLVDRSTLAIIGSDLFGIRERYRELSDIARRHGAYVIEDAAQRHAPPPGDGCVDAVVLSYGRGKPVGVLTGGAVLLRSPDLSREVHRVQRRLGKPGPVSELLHYPKAVAYQWLRRPGLYWLPASLPFLRLGQTRYQPVERIERMSRTALSWLPVNLVAAAGRESAAQRRLARAAAGWQPRLSSVAEAANAEREPLSRMPLIAETPMLKQRLLRSLREYGASPMYPAPLPEIPGTLGKEGTSTRDPLPNAGDFAQRLITLPVHEWMDKNAIDAVDRRVRRELELAAVEVRQ